MTQFTALAMDALYACSSVTDLYRDMVGNINHEVNLAFGNKVSEDVANFVSTPPILDKVAEVNGAVDSLTKNCYMTENALKHIADYNQNIYDSLDIYKHTTPHAIPEFGELSIIMVGLSFVGIIGIQKRHEIYSAMKKLQNRLRRRF